MSKMELMMILMVMVIFATVASCSNSGNEQDTGMDSVLAEPQAAEAAFEYEPEDEILDEEPGEPEEVLDELWGRPVRGAWNGNIWASEYLGLYLYLPVGWEYASDDEIAEMVGFGSAIIFGGAGMPVTDEFWEMANAVLYDMIAVDLETGSNISVLIERMPCFDFTVEDLIRYNAELLPQLGLNVNVNAQPRQIGGVEWGSFEAYTDTFGIRQNLTYFVRIDDGFATIILVTTIDCCGGDVGDYLRMFGDIGDAPEPTWEPYGTFLGGFTMEDYRLPPLEQPDAGHPLVGTWVWDEYDGFVYNFYPDGTGTRGFEGATESFVWEVLDDHLVIRLLIMDESWTFVIEDDVLTLDSRQVPGVTWSYVRQ